jgi:transposase
MAQNFIACDREQSFLLPPDVRDWLPEGHFAWFVLDAVEELDLDAFYAVYRRDGMGRPAYDPKMVVSLLLYAYARGIRSARKIERACEEDVAFRVISMLQKPDHATIARFVERHQDALGELFGSVLALCAKAGLAQSAVVAIDGTKIHANANRDSVMDYEQLAKEIIEEAIETDAAEDELYGEARGDELPPEIARRAGRRGWVRDALQQLDEQRSDEARPIPGPRQDRLKEARRRLAEQHRAEVRANAAFDQHRDTGRDATGRRLGAAYRATSYTPPEQPQGKINTTDLDSRLQKTMKGWIQGYNAQAAVNEHQVFLAADVMVASPDFGHLEPMLNATRSGLSRAGVKEQPEVVVADAGYWHQQQMERAMADGMTVLITPDSTRRGDGPRRPGWDRGLPAFMRAAIGSEKGGALYKLRAQLIEPVFGNTKHNRNMARFHRRGRAACRTEWRLITATHNLLKLHKHQLAAVG